MKKGDKMLPNPFFGRKYEEFPSYLTEDLRLTFFRPEALRMQGKMEFWQHWPKIIIGIRANVSHQINKAYIAAL